MILKSKNRIAAILERYEAELLAEWLTKLGASGVRRDDLMKMAELRDQCTEFLRLLRGAAQHGNLTDIQAPEWESLRHLLAGLCRSRVLQGFSATEIAIFVFSFKKPLFDRLRLELNADSNILADEICQATTLLDQLGLFTSEVYQTTREEVIQRQQHSNSHFEKSTGVGW